MIFPLQALVELQVTQAIPPKSKMLLCTSCGCRWSREDTRIGWTL